MEHLLNKSLILTIKVLGQRSQPSVFGASRSFFTKKSASIQLRQQLPHEQRNDAAAAAAAAAAVTRWSNKSWILNQHQRYLSTDTASETKDTTVTLSPPTTPNPTPPPRIQKPSVLSQLPPDHTPGQALRLLQTHYSSGRKIRVSDVYSILSSCRPYTFRDARIADTLVVDLRRLNGFWAEGELSASVLRTMRRSWLEDETEGGEGVERRSGGVRRVQAGVWIGGRFLDGRTGFDVAVETEVLEEVVLDLLAVGLADLPDGYVFEDDVDGDVDGDVAEEDASEDDDGDEDENRTSFVVNIGTVHSTVKDIVDVLIRRASNPTRDMNKRTKRKYLKRLRCCQGPTARTIDTVVKICLYGDREGGIETARGILDSYGKRAFLGTAEESTVKIVEEAEERLAAKKVEEEELVDGGEEDAGENQDDGAKN